MAVIDWWYRCWKGVGCGDGGEGLALVMVVNMGW